MDPIAQTATWAVMTPKTRAVEAVSLSSKRLEADNNK